MSIKKLLDTFEKEDYILNKVNNMSPREKRLISLEFSLVIDSIRDKKISEERRKLLITESSLLSKMTDEEWEEKNRGI